MTRQKPKADHFKNQLPIDGKEQAQAWFRGLRDQICATFEEIEGEYDLEMRRCGDVEMNASLHPHITTSSHPAKFERTTWNREGGGGGGEMSVMKGRVFEKVGVNISTVHGEFSEKFRGEIPGAKDCPYFWASGISLVAHMCSPLVPAVHMNTRMICLANQSFELQVPSSEQDKLGTQNSKLKTLCWFGGGADLTPMFENDQDTADFHQAFKDACDRFDPTYYPKYKAWCDEYFYLKHRDEPRGIGGIFYDYLSKGEWQRDFDFTQAVGKALHEIYPKLVRRHMHEPWTDEQRQHQLEKRGRYVEFNLLYDRGTRFGLMTGGNVEAILMSLPPEVKWP